MTLDARIQNQVPLAPYCTLELGGSARHFVEVHDEAELREALRWAAARALPVAVLGGGSNVVFSDAGFAGLVVRVASRGIETREAKGIVQVTVAAGEPWDALVERAVEAGWAGIECLSGIPGTVGATPIQNVGAYGQEVSETIIAVRVLDRDTLEARTIGPEECAFAYRDSAFKHSGSRLSRAVVVSVTFALRPGGAPALRYPELCRALSAASARPSLAQVRSTVIALRRAKSMVLDPHDHNRRSAGSFFTNPVLTPAEADEVVRRAMAFGMISHPSEVPRFAAGDGRVKLPAAWLIERAGFCKGAREGAVGLSTRHALALVHHGGGTSAELLAFAQRIQARVHECFGVKLIMEPVLLGF